MRISIDWLKQFVSIKENPADLAEMLSMLGLEAEPVHDFSGLSGVVIGKVATAKKHPNADRLKLCTVNDGTATVNVVCGAPNVAAGQTVAFAQVGAELPGGFKISKAKFNFSFIAIGVINLTVNFASSPGITISVPFASSTSPVTSVVLK